MENPIKMDDLGVPPFKETSKWLEVELDDFRSVFSMKQVGHPTFHRESLLLGI